jgi:hypothetical protein
VTDSPTYTPVVVDYTGRDFNSLRAALISRVQNRIPNWTGSDPSDFGLALIEAFSYLGDNVSYYIDRIANESNIATATQRSSVLAIAKSLGYTPASYQSATTTVSFSNSGSQNLTIPAGTELQCSVTVADSVRQLIFSTTSDTVVNAAVGGVPGAATVQVSHGENVALRPASTYYSPDGELLGYSDGTPSQKFVLKENQVVDGSVQVFVKNGSTFAQWNVVSHPADFGPADAVVTTDTDASNYVTVTFGDGVSGAIPPMHAEIRAVYTVGGGTMGNIPSSTSFTFYAFPASVDPTTVASLRASVSAVTTTPALGGQDPLSTDMIRMLAPKSFASLNRAVTLQDYESLAMATPGCGNANAVADIWSSVTLYVAPLRDLGNAETFPLYDDTNATLQTSEWTPFQSSIQAALADKTQIGVTVTVAPPKYVPVDVTIRYTKKPTYTDAQVTSDIRNYMETYFAYASMSFGQTIHPEQIEFLLRYVPGIDNVNVDLLYRDGDPSPTRSILVGAPNEIFIFNSVNGTTSRTTITSSSTDSSITSLVLTPDSGTIQAQSPAAFSSNFFNYSYVLASAATSLTLTLTFPTTSTVKVNGVAATSGTPTAAINIGASGGAPFNLAIVVTAQDGVTTSTYNLSVSH